MLFYARLAREQGFAYIWIDTCCIDKSSSAGLTEAINSMYQWYRDSAICYAFLADVEPEREGKTIWAKDSSFKTSRWFRRGWTLQELVASPLVSFYARDWSFIESKTAVEGFTKLLSTITGIQQEILTGEKQPGDMSAACRMGWAAGRQTTRVEDIA
ncbi:HET-domain-containing protein [Apiospora saccharicola]|uniref:HET-domain-containing protein n=1 Tax=Apiospora saccharicola TaxID=335842 RepID=A0ABR1ULF8_9PEZI